MKKYLLTAVLLSMAAGLSAQDFSIARFRGDKKAAVSFTFDDAYLDQYTLAVPELEKRGWRGTFWIIPTRIDCWGVKPLMSWEQIKELSDRGHEMSNHGMTHAHMKTLTNEQAYHEIHDADTALLSHTGKFPRTYCFAYGEHTPEIRDMALEGRLGLRENHKALGQCYSTRQLAADLEKDIAEGGWLITMTHAMLDGYDQFDRIEDFTGFLDAVKAHEADLWVDTFENVADYAGVRDATTLAVEPRGTNKFVITPSCHLDHELYKSTLTLCIGGTAAPAKVIQEGKILSPDNADGRWTVEIDPFKGPVTVKYR